MKHLPRAVRTVLTASWLDARFLPFVNIVSFCSQSSLPFGCHPAPENWMSKFARLRPILVFHRAFKVIFHFFVVKKVRVSSNLSVPGMRVIPRFGIDSTPPTMQATSRYRSPAENNDCRSVRKRYGAPLCQRSSVDVKFWSRKSRRARPIRPES